MLIIVMILYCGAAEAMCNVVSPYWSTSVPSDTINFSFGITLFLVQSCVRVSLKEKQSKRCSVSVSTDWWKCVGCDGAAESPAACRVLKDSDLEMLPSHHSVSVWVSECLSVCDYECVRGLDTTRPRTSVSMATAAELSLAWIWACGLCDCRPFNWKFVSSLQMCEDCDVIGRGEGVMSNWESRCLQTVRHQ